MEIYMAGWILLCLLALFFLLKYSQQFAFSQQAYWRFLFQPWKTITFLLAAIPMVLLAPYSGDPTWDYVDASFMSILTFLTAPWSIGTVFRFFRKQADYMQLYVALCLWMFSTSWSYDGYMYLREGYYPNTWAPNIVLSTALYVPAGLMWSLAWDPETKAHFAFSKQEWYGVPVAGGSYLKVMLWTLPFVLLAVGLILPFAWDLLFS